MSEKELHKGIVALRSEIAAKEAEEQQWMGALSDLQKALEGGVEDPTFKPMQDECNTELGKINGSLATLRKKLAELEQKLPQQFDTPALKFDPEKHPLLRKTVEKPEPAKPVVFNTGDICEVQWSGDKGWYKAKILSVMGSTADPKYTVRFLQYDETATVDKKSVRSIAKRKAEEPAVVNQPAKTAQIVISAPASVNPAAQAAAANDAGDAQPKVVKRRKIGGDKALDRKKNSWKQFQASTPQRESQFRVGTGINSRVGITGSGAGMTRTAARVRPSRITEDDEDDSTTNQGRPPRDTDRGHRGRGGYGWRPY